MPPAALVDEPAEGLVIVIRAGVGVASELVEGSQVFEVPLPDLVALCLAPVPLKTDFFEPPLALGIEFALQPFAALSVRPEQQPFRGVVLADTTARVSLDELAQFLEAQFPSRIEHAPHEVDLIELLLAILGQFTVALGAPLRIAPQVELRVGRGEIFPPSLAGRLRADEFLQRLEVQFPGGLDGVPHERDLLQALLAVASQAADLAVVALCL